MRRLLVVCGIVALLLASTALAVVWSFVGSSENGQTEPVGVSDDSATATPLPTLISDDQADSIFAARKADEGQRILTDSIDLELGTAGQWDLSPPLAADYPVYRVRGGVQLPSGLDGQSSLYIDATDGRILAEDEEEPAELATPAGG